MPDPVASGKSGKNCPRHISIKNTGYNAVVGANIYLRCCSKWRHKFAITSVPTSSACTGSAGSTSFPVFINSSLRKWNKTSTLHAPKIISLILNFAGLGTRWTLCQFSPISLLLNDTAPRRKLTGSLIKSVDNSLCGYTACLLTRSWILGSRMAILPGEASRNVRRG